MNKSKGHLDSMKIDFFQTSFNLLMQKRIYKVLIICTSYDAFMLEEDGRIDEQIFNEYVSLNLRYPPIFIQAKSSEEAFDILENENIDLIIEMLRVGDNDAFEQAKIIKERYPEKPIVILTYCSREVSLKLQNEDLGAIDYVFCWLGNADILLAIIKLIEDKMNVEFDVQEVGVQAIILVEDSIRYISAYLPSIYKILFKQAKEFASEALNEHQKMLRMRGRPKILLATTYEEAISLYEKYKHNLLGVISDISFKKDGSKNSEAGISLCKRIRNEDKFMPFLLQSSDVDKKDLAKGLNSGFIHKYSKTLSIELKDYIIKQFAFGDFVFRDPESDEEICRASDLQSLQQKLKTIPNSSLEYHTARNDLSKWLNARALFPIAQMFKYLTRDDFSNINEVRSFINRTITDFRLSKGRRFIAEFDKNSYDEYLMFSRIGEGSIGGKARGLAYINSIIQENEILNKYPNVLITIPRTIVISTDIFDEYMETNDLYKIGLSDLSDEKILEYFLKAELPKILYQDLIVFISKVKNPVAIRSSSKLEDSQYQPFAGIYKTYMIPNLRSDKKLMLKYLIDSIKCVYASVYYKTSKAYMTATSNVIDEEKMGIIMQEVCGCTYGNAFYPTLSGVARSINFYPIKPEKPEDGIASIALGLGKYIVDGGVSLRFSPKYPKKIIQLSSPDMALRDTQKIFYALDLSKGSFIPSTDDGNNILKLKIKDAENKNSLKHVASTYDLQNHILRDGINNDGKKLITFTNILNHEVFPLADILQNLLELGQREMNNPIEIEFAVNMDTPSGSPSVFNFLQIRPVVTSDQKENINIDNVNLEDTILFSTSALGNGMIDDIYDFVYVKPESFSPSDSKNIASEIEKINESFLEKKSNYILVGPGRWGSKDPFLGIPVKWTQISQARLIVESGLKNFRIDPSQGTHFFQNLTSFRIGYFTINPYLDDGYYDLDYLDDYDAYYEGSFIRAVNFKLPLKIVIDGTKNKGAVYKMGK